MASGGAPGFHRAVSLHLARTLDEIGLNKLTVKKRRNVRLFREQMANVLRRPIERNFTVYNFGSQTEGATTPGMDSDLDTLVCFNKWNVIEDWVDWQQEKSNYLMLHEDTAPGYCRLQRLRSDVPMAMEDLLGEDFTYDSSNRVILKNTLKTVFAGLGNIDRNGPAATQSRDGLMDGDFVVALSCRTWPAQAAGFIRRRRRHGWPSQRLIEDAVSHGVFLVPVGYKLSPTEPLEWRVSASMAERCLMFSLTIVHIKCYVVLKIMVKSFIEPRIQKCISSYHCKTALLHCTETTEPGFWREDNLLQCVTRCLEILRNWVSDLFCPQFMISRENLFAGKVTVHNRRLLLSILTELIRSDGRALLQIKMDDLGHTLQTKLNTEPSRMPVVDTIVTVGLVGQFERDRHINIAFNMNSYILNEEKKHTALLLRSVYKNISMLEGLVEQADKHEHRALQAFIPFLSCWLGSLLASFALSHNRRVPRQAIQLMSTAVKNDVASMLKLASIFYCSGKFDKVESILQTIEDQFSSDDMLAICHCYIRKTSIVPLEFCHMMYALKGKTIRAKLFAHCVRFTRHEIHCAPPALRHEFCRSVGDDLQHKHPTKDKWMVLAAVDCLPYLYYLQYLTYKQLGKRALLRHSLRNLDRCVREDHDFCHLETAWNLLGQCLEVEQDPDAAMTCYQTSLQIRKRNNAANWHVQNLRYTYIRSGRLPT